MTVRSADRRPLRVESSKNVEIERRIVVWATFNFPSDSERAACGCEQRDRSSQVHDKTFRCPRTNETGNLHYRCEKTGPRGPTQDDHRGKIRNLTLFKRCSPLSDIGRPTRCRKITRRHQERSPPGSGVLRNDTRQPASIATEAELEKPSEVLDRCYAGLGCALRAFCCRALRERCRQLFARDQNEVLDAEIRESPAK